MQDSPDLLRFDRIEAALETLARAMAKLAAENHSSFANLNETQRHTLETLKLHDYRFAALAQTSRDLIQSQSSQSNKLDGLIDLMSTLTDAERATQGKLNVLIHMWDEMIRERGAKNGAPPPSA